MKNKVTKITKLDKLDNYGNTTFVVELADGTKGFYTSKDPEQKKFIVGQETEYNIEEKEGKKGKYNKITIPQPLGKPAFGGGGKPPVDPRVQMISFAAAYTKDLIVAGKVSLGEFGVTFEMIYGEMINKI